MIEYIELMNFYNKITEYEQQVRKWFNTPIPIVTLTNKMDELRTDLQRTYPKLENTILKYGDKNTIVPPSLKKIAGIEFNVFDIAFEKVNITNCLSKLKALEKIKEIMNKIIGKLEAEGESWPETPSELRLKTKSNRPKVFISYSGKSPALSDLRDFLDEIGILKLIVGKKPNLDRTVNVKVEQYLNEADFVIILATGDSKDKDGTIIPAGNVLHEIGLAQGKSQFKGKIIYLLEENTIFPSNIRPKGYIRFNRDNIEQVFGDVVKEIKGMGFLI